MEQLNDHGAFDWIAHGCDRDGFAVSRLVPPLFSAYRKILHPILRDLSIADRLLSWDQAGGATGSVGRIAPDSTAEEILREEIIRDLVAGGTLARGAPGGPFPSMRILWRRYAAVCASGLVVNGGIYRHDFVAQAVLQGIMQTSLETEVPVLSAVLTPHHFHEHPVHEEFFKQHMLTKGTELAEACVAIIGQLAAVA